MASESDTPARPDVSSLRIRRVETPEAPPRRKGPFIIAGVTGLVLIFIWFGWRSLSQSLRPIEVTATLVQAPDVGGGGSTVLTASGYIVARRKAGVGPKVPGLLEWLGVEEGSQVRQGEVIGRLQSRDVRAELETAQAALEQARADVVEAEANRDQAQKEFDRADALTRQGVVSKAEFDVAEARLKSQIARVGSQRSALAASASRVKRAEVAVEDSNIRAPFSGTILTKDAEEGETVAPAAAGRPSSRGSVATMADLATLEAEVDVNESYISRLTQGQPSRIVADSLPDRVYEGDIRQVIPTADRQKATVKVKVSIHEPGDLLRPDMAVKVTFLGAGKPAEAAHPLPRVASSALVKGPDGLRRAWIVDKETVRAVRVEVSREDAGTAEIRSGLAGGELVVTDPPAGLVEGRKVRVRS